MAKIGEFPHLGKIFTCTFFGYKILWSLGMANCEFVHLKSGRSDFDSDRESVYATRRKRSE